MAKATKTPATKATEAKQAKQAKPKKTRGLTAPRVAGVAEHYGNGRSAADAYRRFVQMFGKIVMGVAGERFEHEIEAAKLARRVTSDTELGAEDLTGLMARFKEIA